MTFLAYICLGIVIGAAGAAAYFQSRRKGESDRLEAELRNQLDLLRSDLQRATSACAKAEQGRAAAEASVAAADARLTAQAKSHETQLMNLRGEHDRALAQMRDSFSALSTEALAKLQPQFLALAGETLAKHTNVADGDLAKRQEAISGMLKPLEEILRSQQQKMDAAETNQTAAISALQKQLEMLTQQSTSLSGETSKLRLVLSSSAARGRWGEETLRRVVEAAGMSPHCDFVEQTVSGDSKPDMVVRLPGERVIIVDSKVPDFDFLHGINDANEMKRAEAMRSHAEKMKSTIKALAERDYPSQFPNSLDYVVLFLPAESLFSAALEGDSELIVWAAQRRIMLATPASFIALLRSVSVSWLQHAQAENAREIADAASELYSRVATFAKHFEAIRTGLIKATGAYNDAVGSYERNVRPQGERVVKLGARSEGKVIAEVSVVPDALRLPPVASEKPAAESPHLSA